MSNYEKMPDWYGVVKGVKFLGRGPVADPALVYKGKEFNYWDMEDALYDMFKDDLRDMYPDDEFLVSCDYDIGIDDDFAEWLGHNQYRVRGYFDDVIHGGYFD